MQIYKLNEVKKIDLDPGCRHP